MKYTYLRFVAVVVGMLCISPGAQAVVDNADSLYVGPGETYALGGLKTYAVGVEVAATGILNVTTYTGGANTGWLEIHAPNITITGTINGNGAGYRGIYQAAGEGPGGGNYPGSGGSYGGQGGASGWGTAAKPPYGTANGSDIQMGSGGSGQTRSAGGHGGAEVYLAADIALIVSGTISVHGNQGQDLDELVNGDGGGGGSGGGISLHARNMTIAGTLSADGGRGGNALLSIRRGGGGGGGGRIKLFYGCELSMTGTHSESGGAAGTGPSGNGYPGSPGTYYTEGSPEPVISSIVDVGNDQGRSVRVSWLAACDDDGAAATPVTRYVIWRRIDALPKANVRDPMRLAWPAPGSWDFVADIPARGEEAYNAVVPTLADSNVTHGLSWSVYFVSGVTDDPFVYYDSDPDSGYSVDNLPPSVPTGLVISYVPDVGSELQWDEPVDSDFQFFKVYRGAFPDFVPGPGNLVASTIATSWTDTPPISGTSYYKVSAVDFNGNEGPPATTDITVDAGGRGVAFALAVRSPATHGMKVLLALPTNEMASIELFDVAGRRLMRREIVGAGMHTIDLAEGRPLATGIYLVRLTQGEATRISRVTFFK